MKGRKRFGSALLGYAMLFLAVAAVVTVAVTIYAFIGERSGGNTRVVSVVMFFVVLFLALLYTAIDVIRRKITVEKPVERILEATDRIASGDFSVRLRISHSYNRYDEYDYIMENLNKMAAELSRTEILRNDFVSNVSHELKTPLAIIQSYAASIASDRTDAETRKKYARTLVETSGRLTELVVNILKLNKLENREIGPEKEYVRLDEALAEIVLRYEEKIDEKKLTLDCDMEEAAVYSAPGYLDIIWSNLLSNAIKFTEPGGTIGVFLRNEGDRVEVTVSDTGCGISRETGAHIFEKFYQGDTSHSGEGNGLGLALVKKAIDILGGEISVESEIGKGTTFKVTLKKETE